MQCCWGGFCVPINALWPLVVFAVKYIWDRLRLFRAKVEELTDSKEVPEVTSSAEWKKRISGGTVVADFSASWCGPCKRVAPLYSKLAAKYPNADFVKLDIDVVKDVAVAANVVIVPTFQIYKDSKLVDTLAGSDEAKLHAFLKMHLA